MKKLLFLFIISGFFQRTLGAAILEINPKDCMKCTVAAKLLINQMEQVDMHYVIKVGHSNKNEIESLLNGKHLLLVFFNEKVNETQLNIGDTIIKFSQWGDLNTSFLEKYKVTPKLLETYSLGKWKIAGNILGNRVFFNSINPQQVINGSSLVLLKLPSDSILNAIYKELLPDTNALAREQFCAKIGLKAKRLANLGLFSKDEVFIYEFVIPSNAQNGMYTVVKRQYIAIIKNEITFNYFELFKPSEFSDFAFRIFDKFECENGIFTFSNYGFHKNQTFPAFTKISQNGKEFTVFGKVSIENNCYGKKGGLFLKHNGNNFFIDATDGSFFKNFQLISKGDSNLFTSSCTDSVFYLREHIVDYFAINQKMYFILHNGLEKYFLYQISEKGQLRLIAESFNLFQLIFVNNKLQCILNDEFEQEIHETPVP